MKVPARLQALRDAVLGTHADQVLTPEQRAQIFAGQGGPFVDKVFRHAYRITPEELAAMPEREAYERTITAALGAAWVRLEAGLKAVGDE